MVGLFLMCLKLNLAPVEGTLFYFITNVIGLVFFITYLLMSDRKSFLPVSAIYALFLLALAYLDFNAINILPALSALLLFMRCTIFIFPIVAFLYYLSDFDSAGSGIHRAVRLLRISLVLSLIASFILLSGLLLYYSLIVVLILTTITIFLEVIAFIVTITALNRQPATASR